MGQKIDRVAVIVDGAGWVAVRPEGFDRLDASRSQVGARAARATRLEHELRQARRPGRRRSGCPRRQKSSSKLTLPVTPTWYADTRRSKKLDSSCTSCSSTNANGFAEP